MTKIFFSTFLVAATLYVSGGCTPMKSSTETSNTPENILPDTPWWASIQSIEQKHGMVAVPDVTWAEMVVANTGTATWNEGDLQATCNVSSGAWTFNYLRVEFLKPDFASAATWPIAPGEK